MAGEALEKEPLEDQDPPLDGGDMTTAILRQSGGSVILTIPKAFVEAMGLGADSKVTLRISDRTLTITPGHAIDELVAGMTPENSHGLLDAGERGEERVGTTSVASDRSPGNSRWR